MEGGDTLPSTSTCLLCCRRSIPFAHEYLSYVLHPSPDEGQSSQTLQEQLRIFFIIRKIFNLPEDVCARLVQLHGSPSEWGANFCLHCTELVEEVREMYLKVADYQKKLQELKTQVRAMLAQSVSNGLYYPEEEWASASNSVRKELIRACRLIGEIDRTNLSNLEEGTGRFVKEEVMSDDEYYDEGGGSFPLLEMDGYSPFEVERPSSPTTIPQDTKYFPRDKPLETGTISTFPVVPPGARKKQTSKMMIRRRGTKAGASEQPPTELNQRNQERKYKFKCPNCLQYFPTEFFRDVHVKRKHMGVDKPFQCGNCSKAFGRHPELQRHVKICRGGGGGPNQLEDKFESDEAHPGKKEELDKETLKRFQCPQCQAEFTRQASLTSHMRSVHNQPSSELVEDEPQGLLEDTINNRPPHHTKIELHEDLFEDDVDAEFSLHPDSNEESDYGEGVAPRKSKNSDKVVLQKKSRASASLKRGNKLEKINRPKEPRRRKRTSLKLVPARTKEKEARAKFPCTFEGCSQKFKIEAFRDAHVKSVHEGLDKPFCCAEEGCGRSFIKYASLKHHIAVGHRSTPYSIEESFICEQCGKIYTNKLAFKKHVRAHEARNNNPNTFACDRCSKVLRGEGELERHKRLSHPSDTPICDLCSATLPNKAELLNHKRDTHGIYYNAKVVAEICEHCGRTFSTAPRLQSHIDCVHLNKYKVYCSVAGCERGFRRRADLEAHMLCTHSGAKPYVCDVCGKALTRNADLIRHKRIHTGEKPFPCDICSEAFADTSKLQKHKKVAHGGGITYDCDACSEKFSTKNQLELHTRLHAPGASDLWAPNTLSLPVKAKEKRRRKPKSKKIGTTEGGATGSGRKKWKGSAATTTTTTTSSSSSSSLSMEEVPDPDHHYSNPIHHSRLFHTNSYGGGDGDSYLPNNASLMNVIYNMAQAQQQQQQQQQHSSFQDSNNWLHHHK